MLVIRSLWVALEDCHVPAGKRAIWAAAIFGSAALLTTIVANRLTRTDREARPHAQIIVPDASTPMVMFNRRANRLDKSRHSRMHRGE